MKNTNNARHGRGMKNCEKVPYSYIKMVCDKSGESPAHLAKMFGVHPGYFYEFGHNKRNGMLSASVKAFLEAVYNNQPIPEPINEFKFENFKSLCIRARKKIRSVCYEMGYSDAGFRNVNNLTAGDVILIEKILNCTRDEIVNGINKDGYVEMVYDATAFENIPLSDDKAIIKKIFSTYTFAEIIKILMEDN